MLIAEIRDVPTRAGFPITTFEDDEELIIVNS